jgi:hypothetical protein
MTRQNRNFRSFGRVGAAALAVFLASSLLLALRAGDGADSPEDRIRSRRQALRASQIRVMDIFGQNYGSTDWSLVTSDLEAHPSDPANPAFMSVPLSLANVYLNRYEVGHDKANLERSVHLLEWVASSRALWGGRDGSGSVVSYMDISLSRLRAECDIGGFETRIDELWRTAMSITAEEAQALLEGGGGPDRPCHPTRWLGACVLSILPYPAEQEARASRAALLAAASSFLADDPHASEWAQSARELAVRVPASVCPAAETELVLSQGALSYRLAGGDAPVEFDAGSGSRGTGQASLGCSPFPAGYETAGSVDVVTPGDSLATAIRDSRVVAFHLSADYLWRFPPGSQCDLDDEEGDIRAPRY